MFEAIHQDFKAKSQQDLDPQGSKECYLSSIKDSHFLGSTRNMNALQLAIASLDQDSDDSDIDSKKATIALLLKVLYI